MNICVFSWNSHYLSRPIGGAETSLRLIAEKLAAIGETVVYVTGSDSRLPSIKIKTYKGVKVYFVSPIKWPSSKKGSVSPLKRRFIRFQLRLALLLILKKERPEIVHTYSEADTYDVLRARDRYRLGFKVIIRLAGLWFKYACAADPEIRRRTEHVYNQVDLIAFISSGLQDLFFCEIEKLGMSVHKGSCAVLDIGYNKNVFYRQWTYPERVPYRLVMVARMTFHQKRQDLLIRALSLLNEREIELNLVGDGPNRDRLARLARDLNVASRVIFHGFVSQRKLFDILVDSHLFCMATDHEGLCKSLIEAMSIGMPVVASNVGPLNTYIEHRINGFLAENDPLSWAQTIKAALLDKDRLNAVSRNESEFIDAFYNPDTNVLKYREMFRSVMSG